MALTRNANRAGAPGWSTRLALAAILLGTTLLRLRLLAVPLERDEGEYAYMGQLILAGELPYVAAHNMKLPGVYYTYAAILGMLGETDVAIRLGLLAINLATVVLLYLVGRTLLDSVAGVGAAAAYAVLSLSASVAGFSANAEHFVVAPMLVGVLLLARTEVDGGTRALRLIVGAGIATGIAVLMKQHGAAFVVFGGLAVLLSRRGTPWQESARAGLVFGVAACLPFALTCLGMLVAGAFDPFWFWTVTYAREYMTMIPIATSLRWLRDASVEIVGASSALWLLAALGLSALAWDQRSRRHARFLVLFVGCSTLAVALGLRFTDHYFVLLLPAASLLVGVAASALARAMALGSPMRGRALALGLVGVAVALSLAQERAYLFSLSPLGVSRAVNGTNPFPEAVEIARYLRTHAAPDDRIAVLGSEPEIYFYARRRAATTFVYAYPMMEQHPFARAMQTEMITQLEREPPRYMVLVNVPTSWSRRTHSSHLLLDWAEDIVNREYEPVGLAEILPGQPTRYRWDAEAHGAEPSSSLYVATFRRRS